jgi:hypothetical protein
MVKTYMVGLYRGGCLGSKGLALPVDLRLSASLRNTRALAMRVMTRSPEVPLASFIVHQRQCLLAMLDGLLVLSKLKVDSTEIEVRAIVFWLRLCRLEIEQKSCADG